MRYEPLISIIIPCYNVESVLGECMDSVLSQTYPNIEVILVDDGSVDKTGVIIDEYTKIDNRVVGIHCANGGASAARNKGLSIAKGEYIGFVDSDDWIEPDMYRKLIEPFLNGELNGESFTGVAYIKHFINGSEKVFGCPKMVTELTNDECWEDFLSIKKGALILQSICNKLFPSQLWDNLFFREGIIGEDIELLYRIIDRAKSCRILPYVGYHVRQLSNSVSNRPMREVNFAIPEISNEIIGYVAEKHPEKLKAAYAYDLKHQTNTWQTMVFSTNEKEFISKRRVLKRRIARDLWKTKRTGLTDFKERIIGYLILFGLFKVVRKIKLSIN